MGADSSVRVGVTAFAVGFFVGLDISVIHEVNGHLLVELIFFDDVCLLLLLHKGLLLLEFDLSGVIFLIGLALVGKGVVDLAGVDSVVILEEVVNVISGPHSVFLVGVDLLKLGAGHLLGGLKALESSSLVLIVVQARTSQDGSVLVGSSANHG